MMMMVGPQKTLRLGRHIIGECNAHFNGFTRVIPLCIVDLELRQQIVYGGALDVLGNGFLPEGFRNLSHGFHQRLIIGTSTNPRINDPSILTYSIGSSLR